MNNIIRMDPFGSNRLYYCIINKDYKYFQKYTSQNPKIDEIYRIILKSFNTRKSSIDWHKCCQFFYHLPQYKKGVQDFHKTNIIGAIAANIYSNDDINCAINIIEDLSLHQNRDLRDRNRIDILTHATLVLIKQNNNIENGLLSFLSYALDIVTEKAKEPLLYKVLFNLCINNPVIKPKPIQKTIQDKAYFLLKDFSYPTEKISEMRLDELVQDIKIMHPIEDIQSDSLREFLLDHEKKMKILENRNIALSLTQKHLNRSQSSENQSPP